MTSQQEADALLERDRARRKAEGARALRVLAVRDRKRVRVKDMATGLFVSCPTEWRQAMPLGVPHILAASLRADGACFVASSHDAPPVPV